MQRIQKTISEFVSERPMTSVGLDDTVAQAIAAMRSDSSDCALILDDGKLVGIFTDRDFLNRVSAQQKRPAETPMREVMTKQPETLHRHHCISYAINRMAVRGYRNVPIVDDDGKPVAIITVRDVMNHMTEVFAEVTDGKPSSAVDDEWTDIGGGA